MRRCSNCINGYYNYIDGKEEILCGLDDYFEIKVDSWNSCEFHNFAIGCMDESNELFFDDSYGIHSFVIVHKMDGNIDKVLRLYRLYEDDNVYYQIDVDNYRQNNINNFSFRSLDDDENGLFGVFTDFYNNIVKLDQKLIAVSFNRIVVKVSFSKKMVIKSGDNTQLFEAIDVMYNDFDMLCPSKLFDDNKKVLTMS